MSQYRTVKTTTGRKYRMPMSEDEVFERDLFNLVRFVLPFIGTIALAAVWLWRG